MSLKIGSLKVELDRVGDKSLKMTVTESPITITRGCNEYFTSNGVILMSTGAPELTDLLKAGMIHVWTWGVVDKHDLKPYTHEFKNAEKRDDAITRINKCVEAFNATLN